jgi:type II secretory pathway predicted ATPase ExeA
MYQSFYGLRELPFELTPNPRYLCLTPRHREALSNLEYGLSSAKAITVLIGEAGTGKTTLLQAAVESDRCRGVDTVHLNNPALTREEFVVLMARRFGLSARAEESKAVLLTELEDVLRTRRARGEIVALVIDEAQTLSGELLEEVRLLANIETPTEKLLPVVLAGQPELRDRLNEPGLRQLKQRVTLRCEIVPFTLHETASYIATRLSMAGGDSVRLFTREAVVLIHERSRGIPRLINVICDNAMLTGFGLGRRVVDRAIVLEVTHDFDLAGSDRRIADVVSAEGLEVHGVDNSVNASGDAHEVGDVTSAAADHPEAAQAAPSGSEPIERGMFGAGTRPRRFSLFGAR